MTDRPVVLEDRDDRLGDVGPRDVAAGTSPSATRPVPGSSVSRPGRRIVQSRPLSRSAASASRLASTYAFQTGAASSSTGSSTLIAEICTNRLIPAACAASIDFREPPRSTVRLRSMLPSGPPPAANTTASQPSNAAAKAAASSASRSSRRAVDARGLAARRPAQGAAPAPPARARPRAASGAAAGRSGHVHRRSRSESCRPPYDVRRCRVRARRGSSAAARWARRG